MGWIRDGRLSDRMRSKAAVLQCSEGLHYRIDAGGGGHPNDAGGASLPVNGDLAAGTASSMPDGMLERVRRS